MDLKKVSMFMFITGVLISIFSGSFPVVQELEFVKLIVLLFLGVFIGLINIDENEERHFLVSCVAFVICAQALMSIMNNMYLLSNIGLMLINLVILIAPAAVIVAIKAIFEFTSESTLLDVNYDNQHHTPLSSMWSIFLLIAISLSFVLLILESFFEVSKLASLFELMELGITLIFLIDLVVLFKREKTVKDFLKNSWVDIIAAVPFVSFLKMFKVIRGIRIVKIFSGFQKITKVSRASKTTKVLKFFSNKSDFNQYLDKKSTDKSKKKDNLKGKNKISDNKISKKSSKNSKIESSSKKSSKKKIKKSKTKK
jgi:MFS family permease